MKKIIILLLIFFVLTVNVKLTAQNEPTRSDKRDSVPTDKLIISSIGYINKMYGLSNDDGYDLTDSEGYPKDLSAFTLFFIEISKEETEGNTPIMGVKYDGMNTKLISLMTKKYPYKFQTFPNEFKKKPNSFFLDQNCRYRLLVHSLFTTDGHQFFALEIKDLLTGNVYGTKDWYWYYQYIDKFLKAIK